MRYCTDIHLQKQAVKMQNVLLKENLFDNFIRTANVIGTTQPAG